MRRLLDMLISVGEACEELRGLRDAGDVQDSPAIVQQLGKIETLLLRREAESSYEGCYRQ